MKRLLILFSLLWTFNLFANIDLFKENTVECAIEEAAEVLRNQTQTLRLVVTGELKDNSHWTQLTEAVKAREKFINLDLSKLKGLTKVGGFSGCEKLAAITFSDCTETINKEAFKGCKSLESVAIPSSVTFIGENAFSECSSLVNTYISDLTAWCNIKLRNGLANPLSNGGSLYLNNNLITKLIIPKNVTSIKSGTFCGCKSITSVTIPDSVTSINESAFYECGNLTSVTIGSGVTSIDDYVFYKCSNLTNIVIPPSVTSIGTHAFYECDNLARVTIGFGVTSVGRAAFAYCKKLTNLSIPNKINFIGDFAFEGCDSLTYNEYGNGNYLGNTNNPFLVFVNIKNRDGYSFSLNPNTKIIMNGTERTDWIKDYWGRGYRREIVPDGAFSGYQNLTNIVIPYGVTCIGEWAFRNCENLASITIPDSVTSIGEEAFYGCIRLTNVTIGSGVTSMKKGLFNSCRSLTKITIPDSITSIDSNIFSGCDNIAYNKHNNGLYLGNANNPFLILMGVENKNVLSFKINEKTKIIYNYAFSGCGNLISVTIPNNITSIYPGVFSGCSSLENITIPDRVTSIGSNAFSGCKSLTSITIGSGITSINNELFKDCENAKIYVSDLKSYLNNFSGNPRVELTKDSLPNDLVIPDGVTSIKSFAFKGHNNLTSVTIPDSVTSIGENAFSDCNNIKTLIVGNGLTSLDNLPITFALKFITIGSGINSINENTFNLCNDLTIFKVDENNQNYSASEDRKILFNKDKTTLIAYPSAAGDITIPDGVTTITSNAFNGCNNLTSVTNPDSITSIENKAFEGCNSLTSVTFKDTNNWFYTTNSNYTDKMQIDVADTAQNATYLKDTYCNYYLYKYLETTITVTADNVTDGISKLSKGGNHTVKVTGEITTDTIASIKTALNNNNSAKVNLDLSDTTGLTSIGDNAFSWCKNLTSVVIPDSVTSVGYNAFSGCSNLTSVIIPDSITSVGYNAFFNCNNIENLVIGNGLTSLDNLPITSALKSITIGSGINSITEKTFNSCNNLTVFNVDENNQNYSVSDDGKILFNKDKTTLITCSSAANDVTIPDSVTTVNSGAFVNCKNVETLVIGNGLTSLDNLPITFALKSITIGNNIKSIGNNTFKGCNKLASVTIGNRVTSIDDNAFRDCSSLTSVTIPDSVTEIGNYAFSGCGNLTSVTIGNRVTSIDDNAFRDCSSLTSVTIPDSVTEIGNYAFFGCGNLTSVTIGSNVTSIGSWAFNGCSSLTSVVIPGSMAKIDSSAFFGCGNLTSVTFEDIKNWSVVISSGKKKKMNVKNAAKNATNLTNDYCGNEWIKE